MHDSAWSKDLSVEVDGHGVVSHSGSAVLRLIADNTGLTGSLSRALAPAGVLLPCMTAAGFWAIWRCASPILARLGTARWRWCLLLPANRSRCWCDTP